MIIEAEEAIEDKELRGADGMEGAGDILRIVVGNGKRNATLGHHGRELGRRIVRISGGVIGADPEKGDSFGQVVIRRADDFREHVDHVGAVAAKKNHHESPVAGKVPGG